VFMYLWKNWDLIGIWSLDLGFGFGPWDLAFENEI